MEYFDHFTATEPKLIDSQDVTAVYEYKLLDDGTYHCLLTEPQKDKLGAKYNPFSKASAKCKGTGITITKVDTLDDKGVKVGEVDVKRGYPVGAPTHVFGDRVREPGKHYRPGKAEAVIPVKDDEVPAKEVRRG
ncbi:MAG: hypothetical protein GY851_09205 [bacterium]|nr:hypothetical protein [bacterium]